MITAPFAKFVDLQRAAAAALDYHNEAVAEAIMHHCALKVAAATAPTDELVSQYVTAEITAKHALLRMAVPDLEGVAVRGRYLRELSRCDDWEQDDGTIEALIDGMAGADQ